MNPLSAAPGFSMHLAASLLPEASQSPSALSSTSAAPAPLPTLSLRFSQPLPSTQAQISPLPLSLPPASSRPLRPQTPLETP
jgi:hypothetical protein